MEQCDKAILLNQTKYGDSGLIIQCFTKSSGLQSFLIRGARKKKSTTAIKLFPLSLLEIEITTRKSLGVIPVKSIHHHYIFSSIQSNFIKSSVLMFLNEMVYKSIKDQGEDEVLYNYLESAVQILDQMEMNPNFHLIFLLSLSKYLGFGIPNGTSNRKEYFLIHQGVFDTSQSKISENLSLEDSYFLKQLIGTKFDEKVNVPREVRKRLLNFLVLYFSIHIENMGEIKSLDVLNVIFE